MPLTNYPFRDMLLRALPDAEVKLMSKQNRIQVPVFKAIDAACFECPVLDAKQLKGIVTAALDMMGFIPASPNKHHCWLGGLLDHTYEVLVGAMALIALAPETNDNRSGTATWVRLVTALGAVLHDLGKTQTYMITEQRIRVDAPLLLRDVEVKCERQESHFTHGHLSISHAMWFSHDVFGQLRDAVGHVILAHHQLRNWGSPISPRSPAAWAVHLADMASVNITEQSYLHRKPDES